MRWRQWYRRRQATTRGERRALAAKARGPEARAVLGGAVVLCREDARRTCGGRRCRCRIGGVRREHTRELADVLQPVVRILLEAAQDDLAETGG